MATVPCCQVHELQPSLQCAFIQNNSDCQAEGGFLDYLDLVYCDFGSSVFPIIICLVWMVILFLTLATTADDFDPPFPCEVYMSSPRVSPPAAMMVIGFCPSLEVIAKVLKLSQNVAGVTFLAFGNGAPDIFSSIAGMNQMRPELVVGSLLGAGIFVTCIVVGAILLVSPFKMMERPFLRDVVFYLAAVYWTFYELFDETVSFYHSLGFIILYVVYIIVVLLGHHIYQKYLKPSTVTPALAANAIVVAIAIARSDDVNHGFQDGHNNDIAPWGGPPIVKHWSHDDEDDEPPTLENALSINQPPSSSLDSSVSGGFEENETTPLLSSGEHSRSEFWTFLNAISPVEWASWHDMAWYKKILAIFKSPLVLFLKLTVPVVKNEDKPLHNWCQSLSSLHCITTPVFVIFAVQQGMVSWGGPPLWAMVLAAGTPAALLVWLTSKSDRPPRYHKVFAFLGFAASVVWIYFIANEIVNILKTIGIVAHLSDAILGLTVLAWGNSLGDLIANVSIARAGAPRMGVSACFGGPLFNLLIGIGIPFSFLTLEQKTKTIHIAYQKSTTILSSFLGASLVSSLVFIPLMKFYTKRIYGFYLIMLYVVFLTIAILNELQLI